MRVLALFAMIMLVLALGATTGCSPGTPPAVLALHQARADGFDSFLTADDVVKDDLCDQLEASAYTQIEIAFQADLENLAAGGETVNIQKLRELLDKAQAKKDIVKASMAKIRASVARLRQTGSQLQEIDLKMGDYLTRDSLSLADLRAAYEEVKNASKGVK